MAGPPPSSRLSELVSRLDESPDPLHADLTPAVQELAELGLPAVRAVLDPLAADEPLTRLHAQRVLEYVVYARCGFEPGRGFPTPSAEQAALEQLTAIGYRYDDPSTERDAAVERLRVWLAANVDD
jgi:hypothetical protein